MARGWKLPLWKRIARFRDNIEISEGCWEWKGFLNPTGYGRYKWIDRKNWLAHRLFYKLFIGDFNDELKVCHTCDNRRCVKPSHLYLDTQAGNVRDMVAKGRNRTGSRKHVERG